MKYPLPTRNPQRMGMFQSNPFGGMNAGLILGGIAGMSGANPATYYGMGKSFDDQRRTAALRQRYMQMLDDPSLQLAPNIKAALRNMAPEAGMQMLAQYQMRDPLDKKLKQARLAQLTRRSVSPFDQRAAAAIRMGLQPGTPEFQRFVLTSKLEPSVDGRKETTEQKELAKARVKNAQSALTSVPSMQQATGVLKELDALAKDPSIGAAIGPIGGNSVYQGIVGGAVPLSETLGLANRDMYQRIRRLQSQLEVLGGEKMRGLGAQSDRDAERLQNAISNLTSARNAREFKEALSFIRSFMLSGMTRAKQAAKQYPSLGEQYPGLKKFDGFKIERVR